MKKETAGIITVLAMVVGLVSGCTTTGVKQAENLESNLDKMCKNFELANVAVSNTLATLNSLQLEETDLAATYPVLKKQAQEVGSFVERIKKGNNKLRDAVTARFDSWKLELESIQNEDMKKESMKRMEDSLKQYEDLLRLLQDADPTLDPLVSNLTDIAKYLDLDLSKEGVKNLSGGIKDANKSGKIVQKWLGEVAEELASFK